MRLLHGSNVEIVTPNLKICQSKNDFGRGFYLTPQWQRAYLMAKRRASIDGGYTVCITKPGFIPFVATCINTAYIQNETIEGNYNVVSGYVNVGSDVTTSKPQGEVIIQSGNVEIHGKDGVTIKNNFTVQEGAILKIVTGN